MKVWWVVQESLIWARLSPLIKPSRQSLEGSFNSLISDLALLKDQDSGISYQVIVHRTYLLLVNPWGPTAPNDISRNANPRFHFEFLWKQLIDFQPLLCQW